VLGGEVEPVLELRMLFDETVCAEDGRRMIFAEVTPVLQPDAERLATCDRLRSVVNPVARPMGAVSVDSREPATGPPPDLPGDEACVW
jgi:hypothetical protein